MIFEGANGSSVDQIMSSGINPSVALEPELVEVGSHCNQMEPHIVSMSCGQDRVGPAGRLLLAGAIDFHAPKCIVSQKKYVILFNAIDGYAPNSASGAFALTWQYHPSSFSRLFFYPLGKASVPITGFR